METASPGGEPVRVAQFIDSLQMGGAEQMAVQFANARSRQGFASHLYVLREGGDLVGKVQPEVKVRYLNCQRASIASPVTFTVSIRKGHQILARQIQQDRVQVVQSHLPTANFWGLLLATTGTCAVLPTIHNNEEFSYGKGGLRRWLRRRAYAAMLRKCQAVIAVSDQVHDSLLRELGMKADQASRLVTITNGVEIPEPLPAERQQEIKSAHGVPEDVPLILAAGRLTEQKNFRTLVDALAIIRDQQIDFRAVIAGEGELRGDLEQQLAHADLLGRVALPGNITEIRNLMQSADLFVLPSLWEGLPLVLLEAMACGLAIVGSRIKGVDDVVQRSECGLLSDPGDPADLASQIGTLLEDPDQRESLGAAGLWAVRREYDIARVLDQLDQLYRQAALD